MGVAEAPGLWGLADRNEQLEAVTALYRRQKARGLRERGKKFARAKRAQWAAVPAADRRAANDSFVISGKGLVGRSAAGKCVSDLAVVNEWHEQRARTAEQCFSKIELCAKEKTLAIRCRGCGHVDSFELGCGQRWFCARCRKMTALRFQRDFERKRLGLLWRARVSGLLARWMRRDRWTEKLLTLTAPHVGSVRERIQKMKRAWPRFARLLHEHFSPEIARTKQRLQRLGKVLSRRDGELAELEEFLHWLCVLEWTPGDDGNGHPHFHVWIVCPYLPRDTLRAIWSRAYSEANGVELEQLNVDVRAVVGDVVDERDAAGAVVRDAAGRVKRQSVASELVKYMTKDWGTCGRVPAEVYAQVYVELDGQRVRQSSSGLGSWAIEKDRTCERCGHEHVRLRTYIDDHVNAPAQRFAVRGPRRWGGCTTPADYAPYEVPVLPERVADGRDRWEQLERDVFDERWGFYLDRVVLPQLDRELGRVRKCEPPPAEPAQRELFKKW